MKSWMEYGYLGNKTFELHCLATLTQKHDFVIAFHKKVLGLVPYSDTNLNLRIRYNHLVLNAFELENKIESICP